MEDIVDYFSFRDKLIVIKYDDALNINFKYEVVGLGIVIFVNKDIDISIAKRIPDFFPTEL